MPEPGNRLGGNAGRLSLNMCLVQYEHPTTKSSTQITAGTNTTRSSKMVREEILPYFACAG
jgi:hypothetical protein